MLTSYRSLQSCMPRVHAGRAERDGRGKKWEEEEKGKKRAGGKKKRGIDSRLVHLKTYIQCL